MVVEDDTGLVGYAVAALDARQFYSKVQVAWLPEMRLKYPLPQQTAEKPTAEEVTNKFMYWFRVQFNKS